VNAAVLFLVFNRPDTTAQVFETIREARPPRLYVAADGPRASRAGEAERCAQVRSIATQIDWPCEVHTLFRQENLGCKRAVSGAIDWFFENEEEGIILEDDVLPQPGFFRFCEELLARYRDDHDVSMISGCNLLGDAYEAPASYFFSRYMHIWGWASWRRAWAHYDVGMTGWGTPQSLAQLDKVLHGRQHAVRYWRSIFDRVRANEIDTWDYQWVHAGWANDMIAIIPARNMVRNLGFGADATHTTGEAPHEVLEAKNISFPLTHPISRDTHIVDRIDEKKAFGLTFTSRIKAHLREIIPWVFLLARKLRDARA